MFPCLKERHNLLNVVIADDSELMRTMLTQLLSTRYTILAAVEDGKTAVLRGPATQARDRSARCFHADYEWL